MQTPKWLEENLGGLVMLTLGTLGTVFFDELPFIFQLAVMLFWSVLVLTFWLYLGPHMPWTGRLAVLVAQTLIWWRMGSPGVEFIAFYAAYVWAVLFKVRYLEPLAPEEGRDLVDRDEEAL